MNLDRIAIVGGGRVGLSLGRALVRAGRSVSVLARTTRALPEPLSPGATDWRPAASGASLILVAVPDDAIADVALALARTGAVAASHVVLHTSGLHDRSALAALQPSGAALGSWHPLQTFAAPTGDPGALAGSPAIIEGDDRALAAGRDLAELLHMRPVIELPAGGKPAYHAAAVFASNYVVVLADIAGRLVRQAGAQHVASELFLPLMRRTIANYAAGGAGTLTGPISRGDARTVARHLEVLTGPDRALYQALGREALRLARASGLNEAAAAAIEVLLATAR